ncbi:protein tumorous imaginal discs, mitochondrial-like, partial [Panonychus citri]|uniref:protein tumorous imaginal discs, mitochondrial-like n=1 Tax=Panonychus citri TaxID=50023 RepID=UPI002306DDC5
FEIVLLNFQPILSLLRSCHRLTNCRHVKSTLFTSSCKQLFDSFRVSVNYQQQLGITSVFGYNKKKNYYEILGVPRHANKREIKKSYIALAKMFHPDSVSKETSSQEKFQEIQEAYQVLSDDEKRSKYDSQVMKEMGMQFKHHERTKDFNLMKETVEGEILFRNIFGDLENPFAKGEKLKEGQYAETIWGSTPAESLIISLTVEEAAKGCKQEFEIRTVDVCYLCNGTRAAYGFRPIICPFCDENGLETISTKPITVKCKCRACGGTKEYLKHPCPDCEATGYQIQSKMASFNVPPGVRDDEVLKLVIRDQTILVTCRIKDDDYFKINGNDIHTTNEISLSQAVLGGRTTIKGIYSNFDVTIPSGTQSHEKIKVKNGGWLKEDQSYGDHIVHIKIKIPEKLSRRQKKIWQQYSSSKR